MTDIPNSFPAVIAALKFRDADREGLRKLDDSEWAQLLLFCDRMHLTIPLGRRCADQLPSFVRSRIDQNLADNAERFERIKLVYLQVASALHDVDADHVVLKGFAQWHGYAENARFRMQSDIDVFCQPESVFRARDALLALGYKSLDGLEDVSSDHLPPLVQENDWEWHGNSFDPEMPVSIDLHFRLWDEATTHFVLKGLDQFWLRRFEGHLDEFSFRALDPVDSLGYSALHTFRHLLYGGMNADQVYELAWFLHTNAENEQFWKNWRGLHDDSLRRLEAICFRLARDWFACRLPEAVEKEIEHLPSGVNRWCDECADSQIDQFLRPNKKALWLHLSLLESFRDRRAVLGLHLFPMRVPPLRAHWVQRTNPGDREPSPLRRYAKYFTYVVSRTAYHARALPPVLWHGIRLRWRTKDLGREFFVFLATSFLFNLGMSIFFLLYNLYLLDRGFKEGFLGLVTSAMGIGGITGTIPAGILAQRFGLRNTLALCVILVAIISALRSVVVSEAPLSGLAFLTGAATSIWAVSLPPAIAQLTSERSRPLGFSVVFSSSIAIGILGGLIGGHLPRWLTRLGSITPGASNKQMALLIASGICALAVFPALRLRFAPLPARKKMLFPHSPFLIRFLIAIGVWSLVTGAFTPFFNAYFSRYLRMPVERIGAIFSISQLSTMFAMLLAPIVFRKLGLASGIMFAQLATAVCLGWLAFGPSGLGAPIAYVAYTGFLWMAEPGVYGLLMNHMAPAEQSGASALNFLVVFGSQAIAAAAAGASLARFGYPTVLAVTGGVALAAAFIFRLLLDKDSFPLLRRSRADIGL
jgi:predicted MFS family arabinose efflux permease